jgi:poly-gamma-glutamate capsule biosynthesis protein CapA/YwtB (metallophosphatase superfamily)
MKKNNILITAVILFITGCATVQRPVIKDEPEKPFCIALTGDIMAGRKLGPLLEQKGPAYLLEGASNALFGCAVVFGNLESPLVSKKDAGELEKNGKKSVYLYSDEKLADALAVAGYNIVSIANNHILDYGQEGVSHTATILEKRGIEYLGIRKGNLGATNPPVIKTVNGVRTAFFCYSMVSSPHFFATSKQFGTIPAVKEVIVKDIKKYKKEADLLFVYVHWGREYEGVKKSQVKLGHEIIDAGADFVFGSHTHMFQDIEKYKGKYIFYGLGNFLFDLEREETKESAVVRVTVDNKKIARVRLVPVLLENYMPVAVSDTAKAEAFVKKIKLINVRQKEVY